MNKKLDKKLGLNPDIELILGLIEKYGEISQSLLNYYIKQNNIDLTEEEVKKITKLLEKKGYIESDKKRLGKYTYKRYIGK